MWGRREYWPAHRPSSGSQCPQSQSLPHLIVWVVKAESRVVRRRISGSNERTVGWKVIIPQNTALPVEAVGHQDIAPPLIGNACAPLPKALNQQMGYKRVTGLSGTLMSVPSKALSCTIYSLFVKVSDRRARCSCHPPGTAIKPV